MCVGDYDFSVETWTHLINHLNKDPNWVFFFGKIINNFSLPTYQAFYLQLYLQQQVFFLQYLK